MFKVEQDQSCFSKAGVTSIHREHVWLDESPHAISSRRQQQEFSVNLWAGIW
jgi:hypothetical protein